MTLNATLWYRAAAWARQARARPDMTLYWSCCGTPALGEQTLLGHHGTGNVLVASCSHCGARWMSISRAEAPTDWRPLNTRDAIAIRKAGDITRTALLTAWAHDNHARSHEQAAWHRRKRRDAED